MSRMDLSRPPGVSRRTTKEIDGLLASTVERADEVVRRGRADGPFEFHNPNLGGATPWQRRWRLSRLATT